MVQVSARCFIERSIHEYFHSYEAENNRALVVAKPLFQQNRHPRNARECLFLVYQTASLALAVNAFAIILEVFLGRGATALELASSGHQGTT